MFGYDQSLLAIRKISGLSPRLENAQQSAETACDNGPLGQYLLSSLSSV